jgi:primase-polymerase (primpol)-like protein
VEEYSGIGIMLGDGLAGVDLDNCLDEDGAVKPWADEVIRALASYAEISPSQLGVKVFLLGDMPEGGRRIKVEDGEIELYSRGRYFAVTGQHLEGTPTDVAHRQAQLEAVHERLFAAKPDPKPRARAPAPASLEDSELLEKARASKNGAKFEDLWQGGGGDDKSAGDQALCNLLAFWTAKSGTRSTTETAGPTGG